MKSMKFFAFLLASGLLALVLSVGMTAKDEADISGAIRSEDQYPAPALDSAGAGEQAAGETGCWIFVGERFVKGKAFRVSAADISNIEADVKGNTLTSVYFQQSGSSTATFTWTASSDLKVLKPGEEIIFNAILSHTGDGYATAGISFQPFGTDPNTGNPNCITALPGWDRVVTRDEHKTSFAVPKGPHFPGGKAELRFDIRPGGDSSSYYRAYDWRPVCPPSSKTPESKAELPPRAASGPILDAAETANAARAVRLAYFQAMYLELDYATAWGPRKLWWTIDEYAVDKLLGAGQVVQKFATAGAQAGGLALAAFLFEQAAETVVKRGLRSFDQFLVGDSLISNLDAVYASTNWDVIDRLPSEEAKLESISKLADIMDNGRRGSAPVKLLDLAIPLSVYANVWSRTNFSLSCSEHVLFRLYELHLAEKSRSLQVYEAKSPISLHLYDAKRRHVGLLAGGAVESAIPGAFYVPETASRPQRIGILNPPPGLVLEISGTGDGSCTFSQAGYVGATRTASGATFPPFAVSRAFRASIGGGQSQLDVDRNGDGAPDSTLTLDKPAGQIRLETVLPPVGADAEPVRVFGNMNGDGVLNGPSKPAMFTVDRPTAVLSIQNYHWNNGRGSAPGTIALRHADGTMYGPWPAKEIDGQGNARNVFWTCEPHVVIKPGTYTIVDSSPATWSHNGGSNGAGFSEIRGGEPVLAGPQRQ